MRYELTTQEKDVLRKCLILLNIVLAIIIVAENNILFAQIHSKLLLPLLINSLSIIYLKLWGEE